MNLEWYSTATCLLTWFNVYRQSSAAVIWLTENKYMKMSAEAALKVTRIIIIYSFWEVGFEIEPWICV